MNDKAASALVFLLACSIAAGIFIMDGIFEGATACGALAICAAVFLALEAHDAR
jgi:hypothetical protein